MDSPVASEGRRTRLAEQRKALPDGPGVYLFRDAKGKVIYVGKAKSLKKRVASHFSNPVTRGAYEMVDSIDSVEFVLVASEAEALLAEQNFIKQYRPRFNIRLRDDKSYPFIAISLHIVPEGRKTAASWPSSAATRSSSATVVGSLRRCSSPTSARAIASRIFGVGRVWVAE